MHPLLLRVAQSCSKTPGLKCNLPGIHYNLHGILSLVTSSSLGLTFTEPEATSSLEVSTLEASQEQGQSVPPGNLPGI